MKRKLFTLFFPFLFLLIHGIAFSNPEKRAFYIEKYAPRFTANYIYLEGNHRIAIDGGFSVIRPLLFESITKKNGKTKNILQLNTYGYAFFKVGYEYELIQKTGAWRINLFEFISPLSFSPLQFIHQKGEQNRGWIYRPEAGLGFWIFQLNYGYNFYFKREQRSEAKHCIIFKINLPY